MRMGQIVERLKEVYPDAVCALEWGGQYGGEREDLLRESWKLLVMGRLSAQCTDARVNIVCKDLFARFPTVQDMAEGELSEIEAIVRPCGLYRTKAQNIKDACRILVEDYGGIVPDEMDELLTLPGVGRKIANLLLGDIYKKGGVVTDTHCIRICGRLGFYDESIKEPLKVERILTPLIAPEEQSDFCHRIVQFGRDTCSARAPACEGCPLADLCRHHTAKA
jgi:endonuclease-3